MAHMNSALVAGRQVQGAFPQEEDADILGAFGREGVVRKVLGELAGDGNGVILVGDYGVGKTFIARQVIEWIGPDYLVVSLRCSSVTSSIAYGALSPVLNTLEDIALENPMLVLRSVAKALQERAKGRGIVLFVDNIEYLDDATAMVITQLVAGGTVFVLATCESLSSAPSEIVGLWRDGLIKRADVVGFSEDETGPWLEAVLGAKVAHSAVKALWTGGGGNPRFLEVVVQEQVEAGTLVVRDGVWVLTGAPFVCGPTSVDTVMAAFRSVSAGERKVAELLALSGGLPLNQLMGLCDAACIDSLQQRGYLAVDYLHSATVGLSNRLMAQVLREQVPTGRSRELHELVRLSSGEWPLGGSAGSAMATWTIDCGIALDIETATSSVREATRSGNAADALRIVDSLVGHVGASTLILQKALALEALGENARARRLAFSPDLDLDSLSLPQWTDVMLLRTRLSRGDGVANLEAQDTLDQIRQRLDAEEATGGGGLDADGPAGDHGHLLAALRGELARGVVEQQMHAGRYHEAAERLESLYRHGPGEMRAAAGHWLVGAWILTGRVVDAFKVAEEIGIRRLPRSIAVDIPPLSDSALMFAVVAFLTAEGAAPGAPHPGAATYMGARSAAFEELAEGLVNAYNGRSVLALEQLVPAASQLAELGEAGTSALACAAIAYAYALNGEHDEALLHLNKTKGNTAASSRMVGLAVTYFRELASAELASKEKAVVRLLALADEERQYRNGSVEMVLVHAAVRMGSTASARRLVAASGRVQGPLSRICEAFGQALLAKDVPTLLRVAEAAANLGDDLFSRDVARAALKIASENDDRDGSRQAQQLIRGGVMKLGIVKISGEDGQALTLREHEIASEAAAGASNKAIAAKMHISVRTVEGHLYQVYSKLQVTSRAELRETLS